MKNKILDYAASSLIIINGVICLLYRNEVLFLLPILCGIILLIKGIIQFIKGFKSKDYKSLEQNNMEKSLILIAIGIGVLIKRNEALFIVGMFWGLNGLIKASNYLNIALYNFFHNGKWIAMLCKFIIEFSLSLILVFDPFGKIGHHIVILGLELIFEGSMELISKDKDDEILEI